MRWWWLALIAGCVGSDPCPTPTSCLEVPDGWQGPVAMVAGEDPSCERDVLFLGFVGLMAEPAVCECACDPERQVDTCTATAQLTVYPSDTEPCKDQEPERMVSLVGGCNALPTGLFRKSFTAEVVPQAAAGIECAPQLTVERPEPEFDAQVAVCELDAAPDDAKTCIWVDADLPCPGGAFSERNLVLEGIDDTRGCSACTCGPAEVSCSATIDLHVGATCTGVSTALDECTGLTTLAGGASLVLGEPELSCEPGAVSPTGSLQWSQEQTVCCIPPES